MTAAAVRFDAIILAGGRSSRLGGVAKAGLVLEGRSLLEHTCSALQGADRMVVVGPEPDTAPGVLPGAPIVVREEPPFAGPAAGLVAGFGSWDTPRAPWCAVVACDMPRVADLVTLLLAEAGAEGAESSLVAFDGGRDQMLAALYRTVDLAAAIDGVLALGTAQDLSMRSLLASVRTRPVPVPPGTTHDVDTWSDARALGVDVP